MSQKNSQQGSPRKDGEGARRQSSRQMDRDEKVRRQRRPQRREKQKPDQEQEQGGMPLLRKGKLPSNTILAAIILVVVVAFVILGILLLPGACSRAGDESGDGDINVVSAEGSTLSEEEIIERAKDRYAGTWVISSITWQGEEGDSNQVPQKVIINVDGSCSVTQGDGEYNGNWEIDGDSLYVTAQGEGGKSITKILSIDDTNLSISMDNGTSVYVRTVKPKLDADAE